VFDLVEKETSSFCTSMARPQDLLLTVLFALGVIVLRCRGDHSIDTMKTFSGIAGGKTVEPHSLPWMAKITRRACGATIICPRYALTTADCVRFLNWDYQLEVGAHKKTCDGGCADEPARRTHDVKKVIPHPLHHSHGFYDYDFALLEMEEPIVFKPEVKALLLSSTSTFSEDTVFVASGWGAMGYPSFYNKELQSISIPWVPDDVCNRVRIPFNRNITEAMLCAGNLDDNRNIRFGDYGGPLAWLDPETKEVKLVGVSSFTSNDWQGGIYPAVFAKVSAAVDWINEVTGGCNEQTCKEGNCMNFDNLVEDARESFLELTPPPQDDVNLSVDLRVKV